LGDLPSGSAESSQERIEKVPMRFKKRGDEEPNIGIAPFVDMVFLLLIFFMVTAQFDVVSGVPVQLPKVAGKTFDEYREKITLVIDREGRIHLKGAVLDLKALDKQVREILKERGLVSLVLQVDKSVPHGTVVEVMDTAKTAGVQTIIIAAEWRPQKVL
jgi:biopolymer transport protein ExbD